MYGTNNTDVIVKGSSSSNRSWTTIGNDSYTYEGATPLVGTILGIGDIDGDNFDDIIFNSAGTTSFRWHKNLKLTTGGISGSSQSIAASPWGRLIVRDIDGDGDNDILTRNFQTDQIVWFENKRINCSNNVTMLSNAICLGDSVLFAGNYLSTSGVYVDSLLTPVGFDSIATLDLTINTVNNGILNNSPSLVANAPSASYQWLDCDTDLLVGGETSQSFTPLVNGNYAVIVSENGCMDTSSCEVVSNVSLSESKLPFAVIAYPNPNNGSFVVSGLTRPIERIELIDQIGRQISYEKESLGDDSIRVNLNNVESGIVYLRIVFDDETVVTELISVRF